MFRTVRFLVPEFFWEELEKHFDRVLELSRLKRDELEEMIEIVRAQTITVPKETFKDKLEEAKRVSPDPLDVPYVALALALNVPLVTGDKKLIRELPERGIKVVTVRELYRVVVGE